MKTQRTISFVTLMGISLLRKKILQYIGSFDDLENLSKICRWMNYYVQIESIKRGIYFYDDRNRIDISVKEGISKDLDSYKLEELEIKNSSNFLKKWDFSEKSTNEFISYDNLTTFDYKKDVFEIDENDIINTKKKISEEINLVLNCLMRKNAEILEFTDDLRKNPFLMLYLMKHMNHGNIKFFKIPDTFVTYYMDEYNKKFYYGIFNGLPKLKELVINIDYIYNEEPNYDEVYNKFMNSMSFLENILNELSKKRNGTLVLEHLNGDHNKIVKFIKMIYELKDVEIYFEPIRKTNNEKNLEILYNNMKIIVSMMPKTVEMLKLTRMDYLTKEVTEVINQFMPNIKLFVTQNVSFKDLDCLSSFKHLQAFIYNQNYPIHIPGTVKLVGICNHYIHNDGNLEIITFNQELINTYSKRFSKRLSSEFRGCIFFNDIRQWCMYKKIISNQFS
uniref:F-box domain-containing protein n=1 Tax=Strongyloides papillosus TaxID=174720 RepID=A0A0N5BBL7_STREA